MPIFSARALEELAFAIARGWGSEEAEARILARHLVEANLTGHDSHGVGMLPTYVRLFREGLLVPNRTLEPRADAGAVLVFDAGRGVGQKMAHDAVAYGIERARALGAAVVALRNSCHIGRIGAYGEQAARAGAVFVAFVNVADHDPIVAPFGAARARLGTNPFCVAVPAGPKEEPAVLLDMATSTIAFGKARVAHNEGRPVPLGALLDRDGRPTTDPGPMVERFEGALTAFGLHKGSGLAIACELLAAALTGGQTIVQPMRHGIVNAMLAILIDPARLDDPERARAEMRAVIEWIRAAPPAPGFDRVRVPGDPERESRARRLAEGIPLDERTLQEIFEAARALGLASSDLERVLAEKR
ncbi:MAG: malate/lactate/ureidoglycolate dehydrogenase [Geminicoccaceae bacterium]|nr:malate/lactate/ureidoglycolate dehydrogenase [Geminicoccaceae bacterium]